MALIKRKAKLFEAGTYADRGGEYTVDELDKWCENHRSRTIPLSIGHLDPDGPESPLADLGEHGPGFFANLVRIGKELFADLFIDEQVNDLVERLGARGLSLGIDRENGVIVEGSWVRTPRIASAAMFNATNVAYQFSGLIAEDDSPQPQPQEGPMSTEPKATAETPPQVPPANPPTPQVDAKFAADLDAQKARADAADALAKQQSQELADLRQKLVFSDDEKKIDALVAAGKILAAHKPQLMQFSAVSGVTKFTFADTEQELRPVDALVKFFEGYDPKDVYTSQLPPLKEVKPTETANFSDDEVSAIRRKGESLGYEGQELENYVANTTRFITEVTS